MGLDLDAVKVQVEQYEGFQRLKNDKTQSWFTNAEKEQNRVKGELQEIKTAIQQQESYVLDLDRQRKEATTASIVSLTSTLDSNKALLDSIEIHQR